MMETVQVHNGDYIWRGLEVKRTVHKKYTPFHGQYGNYPKTPPELHLKVKAQANMYNFSWDKDNKMYLVWKLL